MRQWPKPSPAALWVRSIPSGEQFLCPAELSKLFGLNPLDRISAGVSGERVQGLARRATVAFAVALSLAVSVEASVPGGSSFAEAASFEK